MSRPPTRVVVVGLGSHAGKTVIPAIQNAPGWSLAGVVSARHEAAEAAAEEFAVPAYPDLSTALAEGEFEAVYLATVPSQHAPSCLEALDGGVPIVICEKPLGVSGPEVGTILARARESDSVLYEVMAYQHHPQFRTLERLVDSPEVGGLVHGYARFSYPFMPEGDYRYRGSDGGGSLLDAGIYPLSLAARLLGDGDLTVQAIRYRGGYEVDIAGSATLSDRDGRTFQCSWGMGSAYTNTTRLVGTAGTVTADRPFSKPASFTDPIILIGGWGERTEVEYEPTDQFVAMLADVVNGAGDPRRRAALLADIENRWWVMDRVLAEAIWVD